MLNSEQKVFEIPILKMIDFEPTGPFLYMFSNYANVSIFNAFMFMQNGIIEIANISLIYVFFAFVLFQIVSTIMLAV